MLNQLLSLVIENASSRRTNEAAITPFRLPPARKLSTSTRRLNRLVVYRNPNFGSVDRRNSTDSVQRGWLPVLSSPTLVGSLLEYDVKSASKEANAESGATFPKPCSLIGKGKRFVPPRLAQLRYCLLVLALGGACCLLTGLLLDVLTR